MTFDKQSNGRGILVVNFGGAFDLCSPLLSKAVNLCIGGIRLPSATPDLRLIDDVLPAGGRHHPLTGLLAW